MTIYSNRIWLLFLIVHIIMHFVDIVIVRMALLSKSKKAYNRTVYWLQISSAISASTIITGLILLYLDNRIVGKIAIFMFFGDIVGYIRNSISFKDSAETFLVIASRYISK